MQHNHSYLRLKFPRTSIPILTWFSWCCVSLFFPLCLFSQAPLPDTVQGIEQLQSKSWLLLDSTRGDLNKDNIPDLVAVLQGTDTSNFEITSDLILDTLNLNPRVLLVYFGTADGNYVQQVRADQMIPLKDSPTLDEPLEGLEIKRGVLQVKLRLWYSMGSWTTSSYAYKFRYQNEQFELIGYDGTTAHRASGEVTEHSINFSTRKMSISTSNFSETAPAKVEWKSFKLSQLRSLRSMQVFTWEFEGLHL